MDNHRAIVDGTNLLHYSAHKTGHDTDPVKVTVGFLSHLQYLVRMLKPYRMDIVWDTGLSPYRVTKYPDYKKSRKDSRDPTKAKSPAHKVKIMEGIQIRKMAYAAQTILEGWLPLLGVTQYKGTPSAEGDDMIYYCLETTPSLEGTVVLVSSDGDLYQLLTPQYPEHNPGLQVVQLSVLDIFPAKSMGGTVWSRFRDGNWLKSGYGWWPRDHVLAKALIGDSSDGIPGAKGVGEKTVKRLFESYPSQEDMEKDIVGVRDTIPRLRSAVHDGDWAPVVKLNVSLMELRIPDQATVMVTPGLPIHTPDGRAWAGVLMTEMGRRGFHPEGQYEADCWILPFTELSSRMAATGISSTT